MRRCDSEVSLFSVCVTQTGATSRRSYLLYILYMRVSEVDDRTCHVRPNIQTYKMLLSVNPDPLSLTENFDLQHKKFDTHEGTVSECPRHIQRRAGDDTTTHVPRHHQQQTDSYLSPNGSLPLEDVERHFKHPMSVFRRTFSKEYEKELAKL